MPFLSQVQYTGDGSTTDFNLTFDYLFQTDVKVYLDGVLQTVTTDYVWFDDTTIRFNVAPIVDAVVLLDRDTNISNKLVDFQDASVIYERDLDNIASQLFFLVQEAEDRALDALTTAQGFTAEEALDAVFSAINAGTKTGITVTPDDANDKIDFSVTPAEGIASETYVDNGDAATLALAQTAAEAYADAGDSTTLSTAQAYTDANVRTDEQIEDLAAAMLVNGTHDGISFTYDDINGEIDATVASTSSWTKVTIDLSTTTTITGIPSGVDEIRINFNNATFSSGTGRAFLRIGDSGGIESSGYETIFVPFNSTTDDDGNTSYFPCSPSASAGFFSGAGDMTLLRVGETNTWTFTCTGVNMSSFVSISAITSFGKKTLTGVLDRIAFGNSGGTTNGGTLTIYYR